MPVTKDAARRLLKACGLRSTGPRVAVVRVLAEADHPLSHGEVLACLGETDWDPATIYRNLVKLREAGIAPVVSRAGGLDRYAFAEPGSDDHQHPHFVCDDCGRVACLPSDLSVSVVADPRWSASIAQSKVQLRGPCPDCLEPPPGASA